MHCPGCGLEWLDPQPDDATLGRIYRQEYYDAWGVQDDAEATRTLKRAMFRRLPGPVAKRHGRGARLLDCGAALGYLMEEPRRPASILRGRARRMRRRRDAGRFGPGGSSGPFEQAEFAGVDRDAFDVITMIDFLEHVRHPAEVLAKAYRATAPGGSLVILTPDAASLSCRLMGPRWLHYKLEHLFYFSASEPTTLSGLQTFVDVRVRRAVKMMNLHYVSHQLSNVSAPDPDADHRTRRIAMSPPPLRRAMFAITFGEHGLVGASRPAVFG